VRRGVIAAVAAVILLPGVVAAPSLAAPSRDIRQVQAQVRDLEMKAADAAERFNAAQAKLNDTTQQLSGIRNKVDREREDLAIAMASINDLARGVYMSGGVDSTLQVLLAEDPTDFLAQSAALDQVAQGQAAGLRQTKTAQLRLAQSEAELSDKENIAQSLRNEMDSAKADADGNLADAQAVLDSLQAAERQRLAELQAQQQRDSQAAAQQAQQAIAASSSSSGGGDSSGGGGDSSAGGGYSGGGRAAAAVQYALSQVGKRYVAAADGPDSFDCSGLTLAAWRQAGVSLDHYSYSQFSQVRRIPDSELQPGDLVFYFGGGAHHVAMYVGNGKMVSASNPSDGVEIIDYKGPWYGERYSGAGRVVG
jgi:cell wall-associated NlpC family hydrolase/outer membrane murein-binding lipoprotein Lpp